MRSKCSCFACTVILYVEARTDYGKATCKMNECCATLILWFTTPCLPFPSAFGDGLRLVSSLHFTSLRPLVAPFHMLAICNIFVSLQSFPRAGICQALVVALDG